MLLCITDLYKGRDGEGLVPWNPAENNFSKPKIAHVDFENLIVEPDMNCAVLRNS